MIFRVILTISCLGTAAFAQLRTGRGESGSENAAATAEPDKTAIGALNLLPKDAAKHVARVEGRDGRPFPERWYVLVHDAAQPRGLKEFVVAEAKLVTTRPLSQFADALSAEDVVGAGAIKVNSDQAAGVAAQFAMHNGKRLGVVDYELVKATAPAVPVWRLTCHDAASGGALGTIVLHAGTGALLSFEGFEKSPIVPEVVAAPPEPERERAERAPAKKGKPKPERVASRSGPPPRATPVRRVEPRRDDSIGGFFRRVFRD